MFLASLFTHDRAITEGATMLSQYLASDVREGAVALLDNIRELDSNDQEKCIYSIVIFVIEALIIATLVV